MDVPSAMCLIKLHNGKAWLCGAERAGELVQGLNGGLLGLSGKDQLRASAGRGWTPKEPGRAEDR